MDCTPVREVASLLAGKGMTIALTGAGISVESGIPDFRSPGGLWERFEPEEYATIEAFREDPVKVWRMLAEIDQVVGQARPNAAHVALARLEQLGALSAIITQNIDNLHQAAGSRQVIEFHGNAGRLVCLACDCRTDTATARELLAREVPPRCPGCRAILKPDVVLFGEPIPEEESLKAMALAQEADICLVIGTSAMVAPASYLPVVAKRRGARLIEINLERTGLTPLADFALQGSAGEVLPALVAEVEVILQCRCDP